MSESLLIRRGNTSDIAGMTGQPSEPVHNIDNDDLHLGAGKAIVAGSRFVAKTRNASNMGAGVTTGNNIQVTIDGTYAYGEKDKFEFVQDVDALGPMTMSVNGGSNLPCIDTLGESINFEAGKVYVGWKDTDGVAVFQLAVRGSGGDAPIVIGGVKFSHAYNGIDPDIQDEDGASVEVSIDEFVYLDGDVSAKIIGTGGGVPIDRTTPTEVVAQPYNVGGNNGRKLVRLDDGTLILVAFEGGVNIHVYKSVDDGLTFTEILVKTRASSVKVAIATDGETVFMIYFNGTTQVEFSSFKSDGVLINDDVNVVITETQLETISLAYKDGVVHASWSSKNSSFPNSYNIRYSKSIDGGANWSTPTQISSRNTTGTDVTSPSITVNNLGNPVITCQAYTNSEYLITNFWFDGSAWQNGGGAYGNVIYNGGVYNQASTCVDVLEDGTIVVAWQGYDVTDTTKYNIRYSQSSDNGVTWSAMEKITSGNTYDLRNVSISRNDNDKVFMCFHGRDATTPSLNVVFLVEGNTTSWSTPAIIGQDVVNQFSDALLCVNFRDYTKPLLVMEQDTVSVEFYGLWGGGPPEQIFPKSSEAVTGNDVKCTIAGTLLFNAPTFGDRVTGFKSDKNLID